MKRVVVVGAGWVSLNRHIPSLRRHPEVEVVGIVDRDPAAAESAGRRHHLPWATDLDADFVRTADAATLGTPPVTHAELALAAFDRGLHVLTEKPMAMSVTEGQQMIHAALAARRMLCVVHNFQFSRSVGKAAALLRRGTVGELTGVSALQLSSPRRRLPSWYRTLPGGLFTDEAAHLIYLTRKFVDDKTLTAAAVLPSAQPQDDATPRIVQAMWGKGKIAGSLEMRFDAALSEWGLLLFATEGTLVCDIFRDILIRLPSDGRHTARDILRTSGETVAQHLVGTVANGSRFARQTLDYGNDEVVRRFVHAITTGDPPEGISSGDGLAVVDTMSKILAANV